MDNYGYLINKFVGALLSIVLMPLAFLTIWQVFLMSFRDR